MVAEILIQQIQIDRREGKLPFMLIGTAGTTGSGGIDDLNRLSRIAQEFNLWFHVDAAYGGAAVLNKNMKELLAGIEESDSLTFDAHKWLSVPMGTSFFLTSHPKILSQTFRVSAAYMPGEGEAFKGMDLYTHSMQWSRRFAGLKVYLSLMFFGWKGYDEVIGYQTRMGIYLKEKLIGSNWHINNNSPLPVICFSDKDLQEDPRFIPFICRKIIKSGKAWISIYPVNGLNTLRACITNFSTKEKDIDNFVALLNDMRERYKQLHQKGRCIPYKIKISALFFSNAKFKVETIT